MGATGAVEAVAGEALALQESGPAPVSTPSMNTACLAHLFLGTARRQPGSTAIEFEGRSLTYGNLAAGIARCGAALQRRLGLRAGERVAILSRNCPEYIELYLALQIAGLVAVPINYRLAGDELVFVMTNSGASALFVGDELLSLVENVEARLGPARNRIVVLGEAPAGRLGYTDLVTEGALPVSKSAPVSPTAPAAIFYTSGTTGFPKGATLSQIALLIRFCSWGWRFGICDEDVSFVPGPIFHQSFASIAIVTLCVGGRVILAREFEPSAALSDFARHRVTWSFMVPKMLSALVETIKAQPRPVAHHNLRVLLSSGATLPRPLFAALERAFPSARINDAYGWTESGWITVSSHADILRKGRSIGRASFGCEVAILDAEGRELGPNEVGRIYACNPVPFLGYHANPTATAEMRVGRWETGGDVGYLDDEGYLYILDRERDIIITGGENVYPAEIERVLSDHPALLEVAVVGVPDAQWGESPRACIVLRPNQTVTDEDVLAFCQDRIARYKRPRSVFRMEALPRNSMGKVLRRELRSRFWTTEERA